MSSQATMLASFPVEVIDALELRGLQTVCFLDNGDGRVPHGVERIRHRDYVRYQYDAAEPELPSSDLYRRVREICFREFHRCALRYVDTSASLNNWSDDELLFRQAISIALGLLRKHEPDVVAFANLPHRSATVALYGTARALGVETVLCLQSLIPERMWILSDWDELGKFDRVRDGEPIEIDTDPPNAMPFYMKSVVNDSQKRRRAWLKYAEFNLRFPSAALMALSKRHDRRLNRVLDELRNAGQMLAYRKNRNLLSTIPAKKLPARFVFAPLHLQPEMTTDILGGSFANQIAWLSRLREIVPAPITIVVKENPKQSGLMRSELFYRQAASIPNLVVIEEGMSSHALIQRATATSVVTGTAGWEALRFGKPVICFGKVFWRSLPGVYHIDDWVSWNEIQSFTFDRTRFDNAVRQLGRKSYRGIADPRYAAIAENFQPGENANHIADSIKRHLAGRLTSR